MGSNRRWSCCALAALLVWQGAGLVSVALGQNYGQQMYAQAGGGYAEGYSPSPTAELSPEADSGYYGGGSGCSGCSDGSCSSYGGGCNGECSGSCGMGADCYGGYGGCEYDGGYGCGEDCGGGGGLCNGCCGICGSGRISIFADWLYLQPTGDDVAHAQQQNGIGGAGTVPYGDIGTVDIAHSSGMRIGGSIACDECSQVSLSYTFFESDGFNVTEPPFIPGDGGAVGSLMHHPGAAITASAGPLEATNDIDFQLADIMYRRVWRAAPGFAINYSAGIQYGHLEQSFQQTGIFGGGQQGAIDTTSNIDFDGGGLKIGLDAERRITHCFSTYGRFSAAAMSGTFRSRYDMNNVTTDTLLARANWKDDRVIGQIEYELGIGWTSCNERWHISTGYMFSHWTNVVTTGEFINAVQKDKYVNVDDTLSFDGIVTRVEFLW